ncbi:hypothetical protein TeGR_g14535 [Tetraparma gracilis]|uniref:Autophagy protein ATG5 UblA domain-containing protein n=1 Tax=Tetraparma gracilis TaxID=2962635 RepID=A0ABQ6N374_9STRA|nr:hypothetical protein TeGR_g14535 [Tetraparma gracilis]
MPPSASASNLQSLSWHGSLPCSFSISPHDVASPSPPPAVFAMVPRVGYLHVGAGKALEELRKHSLEDCSRSSLSAAGAEAAGFEGAAPAPAAPPPAPVWFSYNGVPLHWQLPFGVLFDRIALLAGRSTHTVPSLLPLPLAVHFSGYPTELLPCGGAGAVRGGFAQALKQAL